MASSSSVNTTIGFPPHSSASAVSVSSILYSARRLGFPSAILSRVKLRKQASGRRARPVISVQMAAEAVREVLPPALTSASEPPPLFDGTTRLYISYTCPYAQRVWITRNCKVPALEHNKEVKGESLDLIKYIDRNFEGPSLFPDDPGKREFAEELINYIDSFRGSVVSSFKGDGSDADAAFNYIESALSKYDDGPFFLGQFSLVDIAYAPFIERFQPFLLEVKTYDITVGRPKLSVWIEETNKIEAYRQTKSDPQEVVDSYKKRFLARL